MIYKVKISVCFYEKALKNRTISRYDRTIQGNISKKVSHYFKSALFEVALIMDILKVDALAWRKNSKRHFLRDISKSFQEVTPMGPEPHQFFSFSNISTNMVARGIQSFGQNGPWLAG